MYGAPMTPCWPALWSSLNGLVVNPVSSPVGELARIALLRALDPRTRLLIADEVTAQLDPQIQRHLWQELMRECEQRGLGMVIFSHQQALLRQICHRVDIFDVCPFISKALTN